MPQTLTAVSQPRVLGASGIPVPPLGVGTNRWGAPDKNKDDIFQAFRAALDSGINLIDTAELYTGGKSERLIGEFTQRDPRPLILCTKFAPLPLRLSARRLLSALDASLDRLQAKSVDLYLVHFPFTLLSIDSLMAAMAQAFRAGKIRAVGVSNYNDRQLREAALLLAGHGIALAANEVHYSLLHRKPEMNGVLDACRELNIALIAYYPLGAGVLNAQQAPSSTPQHNARTHRLKRRIISGAASPAQRAALQNTLERVALAHAATPSQVALNWLLQRDEHVIAIPGATRPEHVRDNAAALTWRLRPEEFAAIDQASLPWKR